MTEIDDRTFSEEFMRLLVMLAGYAASSLPSLIMFVMSPTQRGLSNLGQAVWGHFWITMPLPIFIVLGALMGKRKWAFYAISAGITTTVWTLFSIMMGLSEGASPGEFLFILLVNAALPLVCCTLYWFVACRCFGPRISV